MLHKIIISSLIVLVLIVNNYAHAISPPSSGTLKSGIRWEVIPDDVCTSEKCQSQKKNRETSTESKSRRERFKKAILNKIKYRL